MDTSFAAALMQSFSQASHSVDVNAINIQVDDVIKTLSASFNAVYSFFTDDINRAAPAHAVVSGKDNVDAVYASCIELLCDLTSQAADSEPLQPILKKLNDFILTLMHKKRIADQTYYTFKETMNTTAIEVRQSDFHPDEWKMSRQGTNSCDSSMHSKSQIDIDRINADLEARQAELDVESADLEAEKAKQEVDIQLKRKHLEAEAKRKCAEARFAALASPATASHRDSGLNNEPVSTQFQSLPPSVAVGTLGQSFVTWSPPNTAPLRNNRVRWSVNGPAVTSTIDPTVPSRVNTDDTLASPHGTGSASHHHWDEHHPQEMYSTPLMTPRHFVVPHATGPASSHPVSTGLTGRHPPVSATTGHVVQSTSITHPYAPSLALQAPFTSALGGHNQYNQPFHPYTTVHPTNPMVPHQSSFNGNGDPNPWNGMIGSMKRGMDLQTITVSMFDGDPLDYHRFISEFCSAFEPEGAHPCERHDARTKLYKLISFCTGKALASLEGCRAGKQDEPTYQRARKILYDHFGRDCYVVNAFIDQLTNGKPIDPTNIQSLADASDQLQSALHILRQCHSISQVNAGKNLYGILGRYPIPFLLCFLSQHSEQMENGIDPTFEDFVSFVKKEAAVARTPLGRFVFELRKTRAMKYAQKTQVKIHATTVTVPDAASEEKEHQSISLPPCVLCSFPHALFRCSEFLARSPVERRKIVEANSACLNCLYYGHEHRKCPSKYKCRHGECGSTHHTLLHEAFKNQPGPEVERDTRAKVPNYSVCASINEQKYPVRLSIVPVRITSAESGIEVITNAFLDTGCGPCLCSVRLKNKLGIRGESVTCETKTAIGAAESLAELVSLSVCGLDGGTVIDLDNVLASPDFPDVEAHAPTVDVISKCAHLSGISIPIIDLPDVDLVVGKNVLMNYPSMEVIKPQDGLPGAERCVFGWCLGGSDRTLYPSANSATVNFIDHNFGTVNNFANHCVPSVLPMCSICNADFSDVLVDPYETKNSIEDEQALKIFKETARIVNGRFQVGLPWRSSNVKLPYNREAALKALKTQRSRFSKDPELFQKYNEKINEYLSRGYARIVPTDLLPPTDRTFYLIHFHTKEAKLRVVFDASRRFSQASLNSQLYSGPDVNSSLTSVLCRFRMYQYPWAADIAQMFSRIQTYPQDSDSLRFLWFKDNCLDGEVIDLQKTSHIFGATCSPAIAQFCLRQIVSLNGTNADKPTTLDLILKNTYVDDILHSSDDIEELISIIHQLRALLTHYGFNLTKFVSSDPRIIAEIPESHRAPSIANIELETSHTERALGVLWNVARDSIQVRTSIQPKPLTRRGIASQIAQVFTPFGYLSPFILPARLLFQEITCLNQDWDTPIEGDQKSKWMKWLNSLPELRSLSFPRCYKPPGFTPTNIQLHTFADASKSGYAACSYFRFEDAAGKVHVSFVRGISRVTPKNAPSIPRLELTAAVSCVKLARAIIKDVAYKIDSVHYWTDSTAVLQSIRSTSARFNTFVHQRLLKIRALTKLEQWSHIDSARNPADIGSRGLMPNQWKRAKLWLEGPEFLLQLRDTWPGTETQELSGLHTISVNALGFSISKQSINEYLRAFSSFTKLVRSTAWILRFRKLLRWKARGSPDELSLKPGSGFLTVDELEAATREIIRLTQIESFPSISNVFHENRCSKSNVVIDRKHLSNPLAKLMPFVCNGIMYVGGRLDRSSLPSCSKHPLVLPSNHHITRLIIDQCHSKNGHCGTLQVLSLLRTKYWILKGQTSVRKAINRCMFCQCRRAVKGSQYMADLPQCRVTAHKNVFHYTMVDYFGPITCRRGRTELKRYGCIFTCLSTRAVHIEVVDSLETSAFLMAFFKFCDIRGRPAHMYSDNASTFVGAQRELASAVRGLHSKSFSSSLADSGIQWSFPPSLAPHFQGCVERVVSLSKRILYALNGNCPFQDNTLSALLYGVSRILNDRPLTPISDDPNDMQCLTPNSILLGRLDPSIPTHKFYKADDYAKNWKFVQRKLDLFWERWVKEYLPLLQARSKWLETKPNFNVGDIVLMCDHNVPRGKYPKAIVTEVYPDKHGLVRRVRVRTPNAVYERDVRKLCRLELD